MCIVLVFLQLLKVKQNDCTKKGNDCFSSCCDAMVGFNIMCSKNLTQLQIIKNNDWHGHIGLLANILHLFHLGYWLMVNNLISAVKFKNFLHVLTVAVSLQCVCLCCLSFCLCAVLHPVISNQESRAWFSSY